MEEQNVIVGEFENKLCAEIARRDLEVAGISANILEEKSNVFIVFSEQNNTVQLVIPGAQMEKAKKILETRFY